MTETTSAPALPAGGPAEISARLNRDHLRVDQHTLVIPIPDEIAMLMGRIVTLWGGFELRMNALIADLFGKLGRQPEDPMWERRSFDVRRRLFINLTAEYIAMIAPQEVQTFQVIADNAAALQWQRNTVAHGFVKGRSVPNENAKTGFDVIFYAVNGKRQLDLTVPILDKLMHGIAHLGGNLMAAVSRIGGRLLTNSPEIVIADREILQDGQAGSLEILPTWQAPLSLLQSSLASAGYQWLTPLRASIS
jgi:hypothetical protein